MSIDSYEELKAKFIDEARTLVQFQHSGIVQVYAFFEENNTAYMVMEYLKGNTLLQLIEKHGQIPVDESISYLEQIGDALTTLHNVQFLHRDIKPENIIVCDDGRVMLVDFGLTKKVEELTGFGTKMLTTTTQFGSEGYAPPEQYIKSAPLGIYTDIYSLGATLYHLLTGQVPASATERMYGVELPPIQQFQPRVTQTVSQAIAQAMELKEADRPQTIEAFLEAVKRKPVASTTNRLQIAAKPKQRNLKIDRLSELYSLNPQEILDAVKVIIDPKGAASWNHIQAKKFLHQMIELSTIQADSEGWIAKITLDEHTPVSPKTGLRQPLYQFLKQRDLIQESKRQNALYFRLRAATILKQRDRARSTLHLNSQS